MESAADVAHSEATQRNRMDNGRALLRDALSYERPSRRLRMARRENVPSSHENHVQRTATTERDGNSPSNMVNGRDMPPSDFMPTPPYTINELRQSRSPRPVDASFRTTPSLTPQFAPAHRLDREDDERVYRAREETLTRLAARMSEMSNPEDSEYMASHFAEINRIRSSDPAELTAEGRQAESAYLEDLETRLMMRMGDRDLSELPPLQRMLGNRQQNARAARGGPRSHLDGLGDRERSFSPDDDQWETMLTTVSRISNPTSRVLYVTS